MDFEFLPFLRKQQTFLKQRSIKEEPSERFLTQVYTIYFVFQI